MLPKKWVFSLILLSFSGSLFVFQNCAQPKSGFGTIEQGSLELPQDEVPEEPFDKVEKSEVSTQNANKVLTSNILISIFGSAAKNIVTTYISNNSADFGAPNSIYDRVVKKDCSTNGTPGLICTTSPPLSLQTSPNVGLNIRREGWRLQACHDITKRTDTIKNAFKKINSDRSSTTPKVTAASVNKAFSLFYVAKPTPPGSLTDSLQIVAQESEDRMEQWQMIFLTLCLSPHWQVL
jgi:hypothetical protein